MGEIIRVLHVFGRLDRGGAETMVMNLYRHIDRTKIQFDFIKHTGDNCDYDKEIIFLGGRIYNVPRYTGYNHFLYKKSWENFFNTHSEYKVVHGHIRSTAAVYLKIARENDLITIAHSHSIASRGNIIQQNVKDIMQLPIRHIADYLFACSEEAGKWLYGNDVMTKENFKMIKNAIDIEKYSYNESIRYEIRKSLSLEDKFVLGHVGSFTTPKNHDFLIEVFYEVQKRKKDARLLLLGDGILKQSIIKRIKKLGIKHKVIFAGSVSNVNDYLQAMDVFVFPSIYEGLPVSVIEAQAAGLYCIISDRITNEVCITPYLERVSLLKTPEKWADIIIQTQNIRRSNTSQYIQKAGFSIIDSANELSDYYHVILHN